MTDLAHHAIRQGPQWLAVMFLGLALLLGRAPWEAVVPALVAFTGFKSWETARARRAADVRKPEP